MTMLTSLEGAILGVLKGFKSLFDEDEFSAFFLILFYF